MITISELKKEFMNKLDILDIELILSSAINKPREYILAHPEHKVTTYQEKKIKKLLQRRLEHEPLAYILGSKEFYGLDFKVDQSTLIPRPETEQIVELATRNVKRYALRDTRFTIIDVGTGSGNIVISIAKELEKSKLPITNYQLLATDISKKALSIAKYNAKKHNFDKRIKFIKSNLLEYFLNKNLTMKQFNNLIIVANLPYLSKKIYSETMPDVKNFEPKSALLSGTDGLNHYKKLLQQIKLLKNNCSTFHVSCFMEISPEQKPLIQKIIKNVFPTSKIRFHNDLSGKSRIAELSL